MYLIHMDWYQLHKLIVYIYHLIDPINKGHLYLSTLYITRILNKHQCILWFLNHCPYLMPNILCFQ